MCVCRDVYIYEHTFGGTDLPTIILSEYEREIYSGGGTAQGFPWRACSMSQRERRRSGTRC